ncbi:unnamed protein product [Spirodela intermedia]|uniref:RING-type E3 ubiquitin transferase n=1 Tax=Spirodela intermedia TaxID=51605 RepID=A0A7I8JQV5_SPIIN|nr:unnamed protein product [Spirodela intermedia]CAA6672538.1 unnamed protein product [Spirodela intermedia]
MCVLLHGLRQRRNLCICQVTSGRRRTVGGAADQPSSFSDCSMYLCVWQEDYDEGEDIGMLSCGHAFHVACVGRWLTQRNVCPICRKTPFLPTV